MSKRMNLLSMKEKFSLIYRDDIWGRGLARKKVEKSGSKIGSGAGSNVKYCKAYIEYVERELEGGDYQLVLDVGCGDWQLGSAIDWYGVPYLGVDVVPSVIAALNKKFATSSRKFVCADVSTLDTLEQLVEVNLCLVLVKDVVQHWLDDDVHRFLQSLDVVLRGTGSTVLITNHWRYTMKPRPIPNPRVLDGFSYCPIDFTRAPFARYGYRKVFTFPSRQKMVVRKTFPLTR